MFIGSRLQCRVFGKNWVETHNFKKYTKISKVLSMTPRTSATMSYNSISPLDPARVKPLPLAAISFYLHKLFVPLHVKKRGVISRDLGYSTQKKKADFASADSADTEYQNSHCVLWPWSRDTVSTGKAASSQFCTGFSKNGKLIDALSNHEKLN